MDYEELVKALRCKYIAYDATGNHKSAQIFKDAADAIETLLSTNAWNERAVKHLRGELDRLKGENE